MHVSSQMSEFSIPNIIMLTYRNCYGERYGVAGSTSISAFVSWFENYESVFTCDLQVIS